MSTKQFISFENGQQIFQAIGQKFAALGGAYVIRGNSTFENLPSTLTQAMNGYVYNVTDSFTTDSRFIEGADKVYPAGTNVVVADLSTYTEANPVGNENPSSQGWYELKYGNYVVSTDTEVDNEKTYYVGTVNVKFDVLGNFVDVAGLESAIDAVAAMITGTFDDETAYSVGDVVVYDGGLYKFTSDHAAGNWDATDVTSTTVITLLNAANNALKTRIDKVDEAIGDAFDSTVAYATGDLVVYDDTVYRFTNDKTAGAWDSTKVEAVTLLDLIDNAEPDELTTAQVNSIIGLL